MITYETIIKWAKECKFSGRVKGTVFLADLSELNEFAKKAMYHAYELAADRCDELSDNAKHPDDINGYGCAAEIRALQWKVVYKDEIPEFKEVAVEEILKDPNLIK